MKRILLTLVCCCLASDGLGAELQVPGQYPSIQQAIDAARDGDVALVKPGIYYESIRFRGKAITVRASDLSSWAALGTTIINHRLTEGSCAIFDQGETPASEDGSVYRVSPEGVETGRLVLNGLPAFPVIATDDLLMVADSKDHSLLITSEQNTVWAISSPALESEP